MAYQRQQHVEIMDQMPPTAQGPVDVSPRSTAHEAINTRPWLIPSYPIPPEMKYIGISIPQLRCPTTKRMKIFGGFWRHWITMLNHVESSIYIIYHISVCWVQKWSKDCAHLCPVQPVVFTVTSTSTPAMEGARKNWTQILQPNILHIPPANFASVLSFHS